MTNAASVVLSVEPTPPAEWTVSARRGWGVRGVAGAGGGGGGSTMVLGVLEVPSGRCGGASHARAAGQSPTTSLGPTFSQYAAYQPKISVDAFML